MKKSWVIARPETGIGGWLVAIPAGPPVKRRDGKLVGYTGYAEWVRVRLKAEAVRVARLANSNGIARADRLATSAERDMFISVLGHWPLGERMP